MHAQHRQIVVVERAGQRLLVVEGAQSTAGHVHRYAEVVQHEAHGASGERLAAKQMSQAAEQHVGAAAHPEAEQREVVRVREVVAVGEQVEPGQPHAQGEEVGPEVAHIVVAYKSISNTL